MNMYLRYCGRLINRVNYNMLLINKAMRITFEPDKRVGVADELSVTPCCFSWRLQFISLVLVSTVAATTSNEESPESLGIQSDLIDTDAVGVGLLGVEYVEVGYLEEGVFKLGIVEVPVVRWLFEHFVPLMDVLHIPLSGDLLIDGLAVRTLVESGCPFMP